MNDPILTLIQRWRKDSASTYHTWFLWEERLKNFRSIRRGIAQVVEEIKADTFGNTYRGSTLEILVGSIAEQRQIFKGADHAFLWKPKLRIPDIYENRANQLAFGHLLDICHSCQNEEKLITAIHELDAKQIKGLGPAVANLLYFLHPTFLPPFNTAIVKGYNALLGANIKLGRWEQYLTMRKGILNLNNQYRSQLSNDLGAIGGLLFDLGSSRYTIPETLWDGLAQDTWQADLNLVRQESARLQKRHSAEQEQDKTHTQLQGWLRDMGLALGYQVWIASNDQSRPYEAGVLSDGCLSALPNILQNSPGLGAIRLIDVLWLDPQTQKIAAGFEVEHSTSIYSGIIRLLDLAYSSHLETQGGLFLVAPDKREAEVRQQLNRPAFRRISDLAVQYLPYQELEAHREAIVRFGTGLKAIRAIARTLT